LNNAFGAPRSLFIGRFQPFHAGHKALIDSVLAEGKSVLICIRDTAKSETDPFSWSTRRKMIRDYYPDKERVKIMVIPDIAEVCYGRDVGYAIREIRLDPETEAISGTAIRKGAMRNE
jgi:cytidyltransferase-like protein